VSGELTTDPVFTKFKFCNVYRASDRVSQFLIKRVIYSGSFSPEDMLFRIFLFRLLNRPDSWIELEKLAGEISLKNFSFERYDRLLEMVKKTFGVVYGNAFILCANKAFGYEKKHQNHLALLEKFFKGSNVSTKLLKPKSLKALFETLRELPLIGDFMAYQIAIDFNYSPVFDFDENDFTVAGDASVFIAIPKSSTLFDFLGILRMVADATCDSTVGSHPCYKLYTGQSFIWLTGSTLSSYVDHRVSLYSDYSQKAASGTYFFPNSQFGGYFWYDLDLNNPVTFGLGGGDINPTSYGVNWTELNVKAIHPSAVWSAIEPNAPVNGVHKYFFPPSGDLYTGMSYCGTHGMSCPISITTDETLPTWATMSGTPTVCGDTATNGAKLSTAHIADLRAFAKALAEQYDGDGISDATGSAVTPYLVFQNEPDLQSGCTVADYISQFKEVAAGVHEAGGKISTAGFGLENDAYKNGGDPTHSTTWVEGFLNSTEAGLADYINIHWYQFFKELVANKIGGVWQYWYNWDDYAYGGVRGKLAYVFNILNSNALTINKPIVFGEIGSYQEDDHTANPPNVNNILQARNLFKEFSEAYSTDLRVSQILWFKYVGTTGYNPGYGLVVDGYQRLSYTAYKTISAQLTGLRFLQLDHDTNVEGFKFLNATNNVVKEVLWVGKCGTPNNPSSCPSSQVKTFSVAPSSTVTIYGTDGNATNYCDGTGGGCDGTADGLVNVTLNTYFDASYNPDRNVGIPVIASYTPWGF
jgi:hypothetical protein